MAHLHEVELIEVLSELPDIEALDVKYNLSGKADDLFFCALGFEDRCPWIPELIRDAGCYKTKQAVYFEYATNVTDNDLNRPRLIEALQQFSASVRSMQCDEEDFPVRLRELLQQVCNSGGIPSVAFDISVCSSKLLLLVLKVLFEFNLNLRILYSEAAVYQPTRDEYEKNPEKWTTEEGFGLAKGVGKVIPSPEHPGNRRDRLPEAIVVFPTFKPERTKSVITDIDESLITKPRDRITWIVGVPHLPEDYWRAGLVREINKIPDSAPSYEVTTFDYKKTIEKLESIYKPQDSKYHITISPLGSKLQSLGIALFWYMRQDVSIVFAIPKQFNARQYSEGCKATWKIDFGNLQNIRKTLDRVGQLEVIS
ncbi:MAG: hypothetical protein DDT33_00868 [Firmicutes bacterium]|nr:hypothetical protein [Bacillota bacterium]